MRKEYDFSKGRQGRFAGLNFEVIGGEKTIKQNTNILLALCVDCYNYALIVGKIYSVTVDDDMIFKVIDEDGIEAVCPPKVFLPLKFESELEEKIYELVSV
jgi:hypothetical protein